MSLTTGKVSAYDPVGRISGDGNTQGARTGNTIAPSEQVASSEDGLSIRLLGRFEVCRGAHPLTGLEARHVQELVCYLLLSSRREHHRDILADTLWGEGECLDARRLLRQALWQLQRALGDYRLLTVHREWIKVDPQAQVRTDAGMIEAAFAGSRNRVAMDQEQVGHADLAVAAYRGDLLEGCHLTWCVLERERVRAMYLDLLDQLLSRAEAAGDFRSGLRYGSLVLRQDRAHERTHRRVMRLYQMSGDRTGGLRQFERCRAALAEELGVEPAVSTRAIYESLRSDAGAAGKARRSDASGRDGADDPRGASLEEIQRTLELAQALLARHLATKRPVTH
nr:BTAD domain-containing putative transcriptional regulator [Mycobacterium sp. UM_NZ2]